MRRRVIAFCGALLLSACGAGGGGTAPVVRSTATPTAAAVMSAPAALVTTSFVFGSPSATPANVRRPNYITASVASVRIALDLVNGAAPPANVATPSVTTNVSLAGCPCTIPGPSVPAGNDEFTLTAYDGQNGGGNVISTATPTLTIVADVPNQNTITLNGVPASLVVAVPSATAGTAFATPQTISVTAKDADGHLIMVCESGDAYRRRNERRDDARDVR
jgi:hypothetical protein